MFDAVLFMSIFTETPNLKTLRSVKTSVLAALQSMNNVLPVTTPS